MNDFRADLTQSSDHIWANEELSKTMLERTSDILDISVENNKDIQILWSGGIDTTAMVVAFYLKTVGKQYLRDKITICHCERSIQENPQFFKTVQAFKTLVIPYHVHDILNYNNDAILVTDDPADMMFGTYVMAQCILDPPDLENG